MRYRLRTLQRSFFGLAMSSLGGVVAGGLASYALAVPMVVIAGRQVDVLPFIGGVLGLLAFAAFALTQATNT